MNPNHFQPGNYYLSNSVEQIQDFHLSCMKNQSCKFSEQIKPIELSEEWLYAFGFEKKKRRWINDSSGFELYEVKKGKFCISTSSLGIQIFWIHQLQNLYIEITGKELKLMKNSWWRI